MEAVTIVPYDLEWPGLFTKLAMALRQVLGKVAPRIDHIGSTSIPGLDAKPIIDIQISVAAFEPLDSFRIPIESLGYTFRADNPDLSKRYFREASGGRRTHIHVRRYGSWSEQFALLFRDYLRNHPDEVGYYAHMKYALAEKYRDDRHAYTGAKGPFIWEIMARATEWSQQVGWQPGPTDA